MTASVVATNSTNIETPTVSYFSQDRAVASEERNDHGNLVVKGLKVFRTGTFRDSQGRKRTWTTADLDKMVSNFTMLRLQGLFADVPVRADHSISVQSVVGYVESLYREGDFLLTDFEFTEPDAAAKWERKTFRARSLEVGPYITNDDQLFYPVANGLAFVDIGAVEHLHRQPESKENPPVTQTASDLATFRIKGVQTTDVAAVQTYLEELETKVAAPPAIHTFRIDGEDVQDYARVQATLDTMSEMFAQMRTQTRSDFVKKLAEDNKIAAPGIDAEIEFVQTLNEAQFAAYQKRWEAAPPAHLFSAHGGTASGEPPAPPASEPTQIETDTAVVTQFRRGGLDEEKIKEMPSYRRLAAAGKAPF